MDKLQFTKRQIEILKDSIEYVLCDKLDHFEWVKNNSDTYTVETPREIYNQVKILTNIRTKLWEKK
jgi:late competence protein required for DNA uptake (superfamily II DNA/RNA helicase)